MSRSGLLSFPNPVNEKAARAVAGGVVLLAVAALVTESAWVALAMAVGFALRVASGPRFSPLGRLAVHVVAPRLGAAVLVPGPPKRFAQAIGLTFTVSATIAGFAGATALFTALLAVLLVFATLESVAGFCAGCWVFGHLMRLGVIPEETCEACNDISLRRAGEFVSA